MSSCFWVCGGFNEVAEFTFHSYTQTKCGSLSDSILTIVQGGQINRKYNQTVTLTVTCEKEVK